MTVCRRKIDMYIKQWSEINKSIICDSGIHSNCTDTNNCFLTAVQWWCTQKQLTFLILFIITKYMLYHINYIYMGINRIILKFKLYLPQRKEFTMHRIKWGKRQATGWSLEAKHDRSRNHRDTTKKKNIHGLRKKLQGKRALLGHLRQQHGYTSYAKYTFEWTSKGL